MTTNTHGRVTSTYLHPAMSALLTARNTDEAGEPEALVVFHLEIALGSIEGAIAELQTGAPQAKRSTYIVPEDPQAGVDCEACQ